MKHYVRLDKNDTAFPDFKVWSDSQGIPQTPLTRYDLPNGVIEVDVLGIEVVWLQETESTYGIVYNILREAFHSTPVLPFSVCGIPLEMALSPQEFKKHPQHLPDTKSTMRVSAIYPVRSCLPVRDILHLLHSCPGTTEDPQRYLTGVFILHAAQASDARMRPWTALFIWKDYTPTLDLNMMRPLAGSGTLRFLGPTRIDVINAMGYLQFIRLGQMRQIRIGKALKRSSSSNSDMKKSSPADRSKSQPGKKHAQSALVVHTTPSAIYTPPILLRQDSNPGRESLEADAMDTGMVDDTDGPFRGPFGNLDYEPIIAEHEYYGNDAEDNVDDSSDDNYTPSESPSTVAIISAAKTSPLLNLSSSDVTNLSDSEVTNMCNLDPGLLFIQRMIQNTVLSSAGGAETTAVRAEIQQLAQEFRNNRRAYTSAVDTVEDLVQAISESGESGPSVSTQRQHGRAVNNLNTIRADMSNVLQTIHARCNRYGLEILDFISQEDANLFAQSSHE